MKKARGTQDFLPVDIVKWEYVENYFKNICQRFGFKEIRTPIFENTSLFKRGIGESTDVVSKEMYSAFNSREYYKFIQDKNLHTSSPDEVMKLFLSDKNRLTLKPEGTAPVVRAFVENKMYADAQPTKLFYNTPCMRHERPQAGRFRQFHQLGIEMFGADSPASDAEIIALAYTFLSEIGISNVEIRINSVGCSKCREKYNKLLIEYLETKKQNMCSTCLERLEKNPMRTLDCKNENCQENISDAPLMLDNLCEQCMEHMESVKNHLNIIKLPYIVDPMIVRGLDYYTKTAFEIVHNGLGAQNALCGGGRYNGLVEQIGGPEISGVGFGLGMERLMIALDVEGVKLPEPKRLDLYVVAVDESCATMATKIVHLIRQMGYSVDRDFLDKSVKAQMKYANKINAKYTMVVGQDEIDNDKYIVKNMDTGDEYTLSFKDIYNKDIYNMDEDIKNIIADIFES